MNYTLITGASKGIGKAMAWECALQGRSLILLARSEALLETLAKEISSKHQVKVLVFAIDISLEDAPGKLFKWCEEKKLSVDALINNAGFNVWGSFHTRALNLNLEMLELNVMAVVRLTHVMIPLLLQNEKAYIMNVASTGAYQPIPYMALYGASKTFIIQFSRAIREELKAKGISVSVFSPGPTESELWKRVGTRELVDRAAKFEMSAERVAKIGINGMLKGKAEIVPGFINKLSRLVSWMLPKSFTAKASAKILYRKEENVDLV